MPDDLEKRIKALEIKDELELLAKSCAVEWRKNVTSPYAKAYALALKNASEIKDAQKKLYENQAEYCFLALSICAGGILTQVFAQTTSKAVGKIAVDVICRNNWNKAFQVARFFSDNKAANFIIGELWDKGADLLNSKIKEKLNSLFDPLSFKSTGSWQTETDAITSLGDFIAESELKFNKTADELVKDTTLTDEQRDNAIKLLKSSKFAHPPTKPLDEEKMAKEIELLFYLRMVMDLDYKLDIKINPWAKSDFGVVIERRTGIAVDPFSKDYPKKNVGYYDLGMAYYDKINKLHKEIFGTTLFDSALFFEYSRATMNQKSFLDAYIAILKLESRGMKRFP